MKGIDKVEIISKEEIYEPTGEFQESGREVIFTKKTVMKIGRNTVTLKSNEPSHEAIKNLNREINRIAREYIFKEIMKNNEM